MIRITAVLAVATVAACGGSEPATATRSLEPAAATTAAEPTAAAPAATAASGSAAAERPLAPDFTLPDLDGRPVSLAAFRGKTVVLEWFNPGCPFVQYAHGEGPLRELAGRAAQDGVVWLAINSSAKGKQGHGAEANRAAAKGWSMGHPVLLDEGGATGKAYGATATPHMFVIDPAGRIAYRGALDDAPRGRSPSAGGVNYVERALAAVAAGRAPEPAETAAYGCSVKYAD